MKQINVTVSWPGNTVPFLHLVCCRPRRTHTYTHTHTTSLEACVKFPAEYFLFIASTSLEFRCTSKSKVLFFINVPFHLTRPDILLTVNNNLWHLAIQTHITVRFKLQFCTIYESAAGIALVTIRIQTYYEYLYLFIYIILLFIFISEIVLNYYIFRRICLISQNDVKLFKISTLRLGYL